MYSALIGNLLPKISFQSLPVECKTGDTLGIGMFSTKSIVPYLALIVILTASFGWAFNARKILTQQKDCC